MWSIVCRLSAVRSQCAVLRSLKYSTGLLSVLGEKHQQCTCGSVLPPSRLKIQHCHRSADSAGIKLHANLSADSSSSQEISELDFNEFADETLESMLTELEDYLEELDMDDADVDYGQGVLTLKLGAKGTFVVNKQAPNRQIWLSSPVSGPFRYDLIKKEWLYSRDGHKLQTKMKEELQELCGHHINL